MKKSQQSRSLKKKDKNTDLLEDSNKEYLDGSNSSQKNNIQTEQESHDQYLDKSAPDENIVAEYD
jgi:hypothetical protein